MFASGKYPLLTQADMTCALYTSASHPKGARILIHRKVASAKTDQNQTWRVFPPNFGPRLERLWDGGASLKKCQTATS
jgi:hypothetical protein